MYSGPEWRTFVAPDNSFQASYPDTPVHETAPAPFPFPGEQAFFTVVSNVATYRVSYVFAPPNLKGAQEAFVTDAAAQVGGRLEVDKTASALTDGQADHLDFQIFLDDGSIVYGRIVKTKKRLFRLMVSRPQVQESPSDVEFFFKNFTPRER